MNILSRVIFRRRLLSLMRDLIELGYLGDGVISEAEESYIGFIMSWGDIDEQLVDAILESPSVVADSYPLLRRDKVRYMMCLVRLMMIGGRCSREEIEYCEMIASRLRLADDVVRVCVISYAHQYPDAAVAYIVNSGIRYI